MPIDPKREAAIRTLQQAQTLSAADPLGAGVLFGRAFDIWPFGVAALNAAVHFRIGGDIQRAALWYRKFLGSNPAHYGLRPEDVERATKEAHDFLAANNLTLKPKYEATRSVGAEYVSTDSKYLKKAGIKDVKKRAEIQGSGLAREEVSPGEPVFGLVTPVILATLDKKMSLSTYQNTASRLLGPGVNTFQLLVEFALEWLKLIGLSNGKTLDNIKEDLAAIGIAVKFTGVDPTNPPTPLLDAVKNFKVEYVKTTAGRDPYRLTLHEGKIKQGTPKAVFDTSATSTAFSGAGWAIYVMSQDGDIYAASHRVGKFHHSSLLGGSETAAAGEVRVVDGQLRDITNKSGHYQPRPIHLVQAIKEFKMGLGQSSMTAHVLGKTASSGFQAKPWGSANDFVDKFENNRPQFLDKWRNVLGFRNDPFEGAPGPAVAPPSVSAAPSSGGGSSVPPPPPAS